MCDTDIQEQDPSVETVECLFMLVSKMYCEIDNQAEIRFKTSSLEGVTQESVKKFIFKARRLLERLEKQYGLKEHEEKKELEDKIHPKHYESMAIALEPIDFCEVLPFNSGNAIKYCFRAGLKEGNSELDDLKKAQYYLRREDSLLQDHQELARFSALFPFLQRSKAPIFKAMNWNWVDGLPRFFINLEHTIEERIKELEGKECASK